jgi:hypothetical protein
MANLRDVLKVVSPVLGAAGVFDEKKEDLKNLGAEAVMPGMNGSKAAGMKKGGKVSSASSRADGIAQRGKTKGTMVMCGGGMTYGKKK